MPAFYNAPRTILDTIDHSVGRVLDLFGLDSALVRRWNGPSRKPAAKHRPPSKAR